MLFDDIEETAGELLWRLMGLKRVCMVAKGIIDDTSSDKLCNMALALLQIAPKAIKMKKSVCVFHNGCFESVFSELGIVF